MLKATEQFLPVVMLIMLYNQGLTLESMDEIPKYDRSGESY